MPIFEYVCSDCHSDYDILHKGRENADIIECPSCHSKRHIKKLSTFATAASGAYSFAEPSCASGSCGVPSSSSCAGGMCGLS